MGKTYYDLGAFLDNDSLSGRKNTDNQTIPDIEEFLSIQDEDEIAALDIRYLRCLGVGPRQYKALTEAGFRRIGDLGEGIGIPLREIAAAGETVGRRDSVSDLLCQYLVACVEQKIKAPLNDRYGGIALLRGDGQSLRDFGERRGLTRERVRQIENKYLHSINRLMMCIVSGFFDQKGYMTRRDILDLSDNEKLTEVLLLWCQRSQGIRFSEEDDMYLPQEEI